MDKEEVIALLDQCKTIRNQHPYDTHEYDKIGIQIKQLEDKLHEISKKEMEKKKI